MHVVLILQDEVDKLLLCLVQGGEGVGLPEEMEGEGDYWKDEQ